MATALEPTGPFTDDSTAPMECQRALGGSIDPQPFVETNSRPCWWTAYHAWDGPTNDYDYGRGDSATSG
jgi:beta-xylosidase